MTTPVITMKRGTSFSVTCVYKVDNVAQPVDDITITSQVRTYEGTLVATLTPVKTSEVGEFTIFAATESWTLGRLIWDIKYTTASNKVMTDTVEIRLNRSATE